MFRTERLPTHSHGFMWEISQISGSLLRSRGALPPAMPRSEKIRAALHFVEHPFSCHPNGLFEKPLSADVMNDIEVMHNNLLKIGSSRFLISLLYASFQNKIFENTQEALYAISKIKAQAENKDKLCLQRALLAAKISKSFKDHGVIFIGAHIPTADMHAWIIEEGMQPDYQDRNWVNYRPLLGITLK